MGTKKKTRTTKRTASERRQRGLRLTDEEHARWVAAALEDRRSLSDWIRLAAERQIERQAESKRRRRP